jgi:Rrf2 family protein
MVREGLVVSTRGRDGGYELGLPPVDIRYGDIIRLTRGSLALVPCASRNAHEHCSNCLPEAECRLRGLMLTLRDEMASMLDRITLADSIALVPSFPDVVQQSAA